MKKSLMLALLLLALAPLLPAEVPGNWTVDLDAAKVRAKKENKAVYVLFTGSDWCPYCVKLHKDVLSKKEFQQFAAKKLILVYCDFPRGEKPDAAQLARQQRWAGELKAGGGVPCAVILSANGEILGRISGYMPLDAYLKKLKEIVR